MAVTFLLREKIKTIIPAIENIVSHGVNDRVIRNQKEYAAIRKYIYDNPLKWNLDDEFPENIR